MFPFPGAHSGHDEHDLVLDQITAQLPVYDTALSPDLSFLNPIGQESVPGGLSTILEGQEHGGNMGFDSTAAICQLGWSELFENFVMSEPRLDTPLNIRWPWEICYEGAGEADYTDTLPTVSLRSTQPPCSSGSLLFPSDEQASEFESRKPNPPVNHGNMAGALSGVPWSPMGLPKSGGVSPWKGEFSCCGRSYKRLKELRRHKRLEHSEQPSEWRCPKPGCARSVKGFTRKDRCRRHVKAHGGAYNNAPWLNLIAQDCYGRAWPTSESYQELEPPGSSSRNKLQPALRGVAEQAVAAESGSENAIQAESTGIESPSSVSVTRKDAASLQGGLRGEESAVGPQRPYNCTIDGCTRGFSYRSDCARHEKSMHNTGEGYRCAVIGCKKAGKVWTRLDNFKGHLNRWHGDEDREQLVQKSRFSRSTDSGLPSTWIFTIVTPNMLN